MKIDRKKIGNRCGYDQNECMLLAKHLSMLSDDEFIQELRRIKVWNYGKCELGLWADILDRLDGILENAATRVGVWTIKVDLPENEKLVEDVVTVLEFTGHLIEHSIYRCLYGSWNHILTLFGSSNMDILLAVLGLTYNFSKRSNYFSRLDAANKKMILDRLISIAETWGGSESHFDLASCCQSDHFPPTAGNIYFEYQPEVANPSNHEKSDGVAVTSPNTVSLLGPGVIIEDLKGCRESPSQIMETILEKHPVPVPNRMALFARIRLAVYFSDPEKRSKCIRARLQAISTLCYTFEINDRLLYPSLVDELVDVLQLPDGEFMEIKACALRTMTAIFSSHRVNVNLMSILESTGMSSFHGALPTRIRKWIQGLVDGSCDAAGGSVNQQYTIALLSFLYHLASFEENIGSGSGQNHATTLSTSGILDSMLQLIAWHVPRNDCLSYVTRAVRVTDQILMNAATNRQTVVNRLVDRLGYEVDLVLSNNGPGDETGSQASLLNTQRSGLMKSILNLLKRLCLDTDWNDAVRTSMENNLPQILSSIYKNSVFHFTPHLALFAMETITNYIYTYPSRISNMQDSGITCGILSALTTQPLPQNRDFLVHLPSILNTLALNTRGRAALRSCGILNKYLETLVSPDYLSTMKARRVRDFHSQIYSLAPSAGQAFSTNLTASQMSNSIQELLRSHNELKPTVFQSLVECFRKVVRLGCSQSAPILPPPETLGSNELEGEGSCRSFNQSYPTHTRNLNVFSSENRSGGRMTVTSAAVIDATNPAASRTAGGVLLDEDLVMLSGSEDNGSAEDDDDNDDMPDVSLTASRTTVSSNTSFLTSTARTELIATNASSASERHITATDGDTPDQKPSSSAEASTFSDVPDSFQNLPEYILNLCKFVERLLPSMQHVTEGMCRQFVNQGGLQVLCDLLTMPGLPYDFPVSAACASLCKIFEQLVSYLSLNDLLKPVLQALQDGLSKVDNFLASETAEYSVLLRDCSANETNVLHGLVCISSILCVLVQIINHLKSEHRCGFASFWVQRNISGQLGKLYHKVSWEAVILLKTICDESKDHNQSGPSTGCPLSVDPNETCGSTQASQSKPSLSMPAFVEALSVYRILKPCLQAHQSAKTKSLAHYILHVCSYFINSVTELCTTLTRFCVASPSQPQRRLLMSSFDQVPLSLKTSVLTQVAQLAIGALCWQPPDSIVNNSEFLLFVYAVRYSSVRLAHLLLFDASSKSPHIQMLNVFYMLNGIPSLFSIFNDLASLNSSSDFLSGALSSVLEEWFACVNRLSNIAAVRAEVKKISETDAIHFDTDKYAHYVSRLSLQPLELLCCHGVLLNYLSQRAVEHLLNMLINIVQYVFTEEPDQLADVEGSEKPASGDGTPAPLKTGATSVNPEPDSTPVIAAGDSETPSRTSESSRAAVRMLEEMGFAARTAELALEESNWNTADAVNLLLLSLDDFAPFNFNPSGVAPERPAALFPFPNEVEGPNSVPVQTSGALLDSLIYEASSRGPAEESLWVPLTSDYPTASSTVVPMTDAEVERLRESLRKNIFPACYAIARLHKTDEILHQISELMLCSKQETQCIENLVAAVTTNLFASLGVLLPTRSSPVADTGVGLHLIALLFTRCRFICAQIVHKYSLISVLTALLTGDVDALLSHPLPVLLNLGESSTTSSQCVSSQSLVALDGDENLLMLAAIILDQYERAVGAIRLRKKTVELYKDCHSWSWFDERANLWHPQSPDLFQAADVAFHSGATRAQWSVDRNRYAVEFPTMTQINLSSMHRRPVLLMPCSPSPGSSDSPRPTGSTTQMTDYESMLINMEAPVSLSADLRKNLCLALLRRFSRSADKPLSAECLNSFLRLLLRLTASSFEDAKTVANADGLRILFTLSHPFEFSSQYSAFVGHIIRQIFDDPSTVAATLQQILNKFAEGVCSSCRDLFYLLSLCAPLVAKAEELSIRLMKETFSLVVDEKSIEDGVLPKSFSIATPLETSANDATVDLSPELNSHQKQIVAFIIEALVKPLTPTGILKAPAQTHDGCSRVPTVVGGNGTASKVTSDSEAQSQEDNPEELLPLYVGLAKQDYLRYLVDLAITSRRVAEFISKYIYDGVKGTTDRSSFVSYLFATELQEQANMELTVLLLETLAFNTSLPTQSAIISEFKSSLRDIVSEGLAPLNNPDEGHKRNQRIIAHMRFLDQLLFLPPPTSVHIIKQIYKRQIPCDIAKLLALVNCNLTNTQQTLNFLVKVLEVLTESAQHNRPDLSAPGRPQQRRQNYVTVMTTVADNLHSATETANPVMSSLAPSVEGEPMLVDLTPPTSSNSRRAAAPVSTQENSPHQQHPPAEGMEHVDTTESRSPEESSSAADIHAQASDLSFSESVFSRGDIVLHSLTGLQDLSRQGMRQSSDTWALAETASDQDDSEGGNTENGLLILDDDDEDEGSAGQGGETDNSQDGGEEDVEDRQDLSGSTRRRNSDSFDRYSIEDDDDHGDHSDGRSLSVFSRNQLSPILGGVSIENSNLMEGTRRVSADEEDPEDSFREEDDDDDDGEDDDDDGGDDDEDDDDEAEDSDWNVLDQAYEHTANDEEDSAREAVLTVRGLSLLPVDQANRSENTNLMAALVSDVLNPVDVPPPWSHQLAYAPNQHRSVRRDRDRDGFLLQFSTVGSGGTGGHGLSRHDIGWAVSRPRSFFDFSFGIPAGANGVPITSNVFPGLVNANFTPSISQATESMMFGSHAATFSGGGALSVAQTNALQNLQPSLPTQHPLLQYPHAHYALGDVSLRNGGSSAGGFSNSPALRHQPYMSTPNASNNLSSSREGPVISILLPSSRVAVSGSSSTQSASARFGRSNPTAQLPLVLRTSFNRQRLTGGSGASAAAVVATPSAGGSGFNRRTYEVYSSGFHSSQRNRRRGNAPQATSASSPSQSSAQHSQQEADALAWEMLSSFADYQASAISAFTLSASDSVSAGGRMDSLSPCLLFSILTNFRRLIDVCRILYGQEVMDMILLSRFEVGLHAIRRRGDEFRERLAAHQASVVNATGAAEATGETTLGHSSAAAQVPLLTPTTEDKSSRAGPSDDRDTQAANEAEWAEPHVPSNLISSVRPQASMEHQDANRSDQEIAGILTSSEAVPASSPEQTTTGDAQSRTLTPSTGTASVVTEEVHVPVTDEETIASMVAEGMDPSFLDALPEDVRRELLADHRRTRQLRSQLSSMQLPEHVSAEFLSSLPPSIQEEVLTQVRQETQRQADSDDTQNQSTARAGDAANGPEATPENNAAFLASLPPSVRREVLADMEDFQIDLLPPDLQQEARTLRREHEAQFARAVQGRSLPGLFRPRLDTTYFWQTLSGFGRWDSRAGSYNRFIRNGETPVLGSRGPSAFSGLQSLFSGRNRHLLDHEGLTCILTLLVVSSACPVQRRHTVPALKRVLRNLASQPGIRNWIICTILSLLKRLSEKPLPPDYSVGCSRSSASTQSALCGPMANSLFAAGFEAALGCWVRIFHPIPALSAQPPPLADESAPGPSTSKPISADFVYIVHPQAVNLVCSTLLDAIADLARNCPPQFFPLAPHASQCQEYTSETTQPPDDLQDVPELQTDFWDILARLNKVPPSLCNSEQSQKPAAATSPSTSSALNRSSQRKPRTSGAVSGSSRRSHPPVTRSRNHQQPTDAPANANTALPENGANVKPKRNSPTSADVDTDVCCLDYFSQLANLLRHPVISCRPPLQEKLLSILVGVVREFCKRSRALNQPSTTTEPFINRGDVGPVNTIAEVTTSGATPSQYAADPVASSSAVSGDAPERITKKPVTDLMLCPQPAVIECLCELVVAAKTTEQARSLSVRLVILIAQANATTKAQMLGYLCAAASDLSAIISRQLKVVINEVDNLPPSAKASLPSNSKTTIPLSASMTRLSSVSDPGVSDAADVNDRSLAPTSVISVASSSTAPPPTVSELELSSLQPLTTSRSEQSRLCCVLHLILHMLSCGSEGISTDDPPTKVTMESIDGLSQLWEDLSHTMDRLETTNDANTVLLLQPLVESLCLAHSTVLRENNTVRRLSRVSTIGAVPSGISFFPNLLPPEADLYEMPPITNASPAFGQSSTNAGAEPLSPAPIIDLNRPMSPPLINLPNAPDTVPDTASSPIARLAETHRTSLNHILRNFSGNLSESSFVAFLSYPRALDFDIKRRFFRQRLQALANRDGSVSRFEDEPVVVSRGRIFEDSYARLHRKSASEWKHKFVIRFQNEEGQDAGGLLREWYLLMSREIFNPNYCLFRVSPADRVTYTINPASFINSNHLSYFKFVGRFIGKAIYDNKLLECYFTRSFYKHMLGVRVRFVDLESEDYDFYKGLEFLLKHDVSELGYDVTFSTEINEFGKNETRDLIEDGRNIIVTEANKNEYVRLVCQERMTGAIRQQLNAFLEGFYEIIPKSLISIFNEQELELLISGLPNIDIEDLKANTTYSKYQPNSPQVRWFWRALESFDQEDRARFLQFITGTSKVPLGGFANLEGMHGPTKFQISRAVVSSINHLPSAHTCFNTLELPPYESYEQLRERLLTAIRECSEGYGMA